MKGGDTAGVHAWVLGVGFLQTIGWISAAFTLSNRFGAKNVALQKAETTAYT